MPKKKFETDCKHKCRRYQYFWTTKASHVTWNMMEYDSCMRKCIQYSLKVPTDSHTSKTENVYLKD